MPATCGNGFTGREEYEFDWYKCCVGLEGLPGAMTNDLGRVGRRDIRGRAIGRE